MASASRILLNVVTLRQLFHIALQNPSTAIRRIGDLQPLIFFSEELQLVAVAHVEGDLRFFQWPKSNRRSGIDDDDATICGAGQQALRVPTAEQDRGNASESDDGSNLGLECGAELREGERS